MAPGLAILQTRRRAARIGACGGARPRAERDQPLSHAASSAARARTGPGGVSVVDGTPTDCVILALSALLEERPTVCFSGVNHGSNMGEDVLYSGTVAAAMEATVLGIPSVAVSYAGRDLTEGLGLVRASVRPPAPGCWPEPFPHRHPLQRQTSPRFRRRTRRGVRVTRLGPPQVQRFADARGHDPMGKEYYWIGASTPAWSGSADSDFRAVEEGYVSVTPAPPRPHQLPASRRGAGVGSDDGPPLADAPSLRLGAELGRDAVRRLGALRCSRWPSRRCSRFPPDPLLLALCLGAPAASMRFAALTTAASVLGGVIGYGHRGRRVAPLRPVLLRPYPRRVAGELRARAGTLRALRLLGDLPGGPDTRFRTRCSRSRPESSPSISRFSCWPVASRGDCASSCSEVWSTDGAPRCGGAIDRHFNTFTWIFGILLVAGFAVVALLR